MTFGMVWLSFKTKKGIFVTGGDNLGGPNICSQVEVNLKLKIIDQALTFTINDVEMHVVLL